MAFCRRLTGEFPIAPKLSTDHASQSRLATSTKQVILLRDPSSRPALRQDRPSSRTHIPFRRICHRSVQPNARLATRKVEEEADSPAYS